jgi:hypothetical protein
MQQSIFSDAVNQNDDGKELVAQEAATTSISLMPHRERSNNIIFLMLREPVVLPGSVRRQ